MTDHFAFAFVLLAWVILPFAAWLIYWVIKRLRGGKTDEGESDA